MSNLTSRRNKGGFTEVWANQSDFSHWENYREKSTLKQFPNT